MKEQNFNEQQSLEVISRMIAETSADIEKGSGRYFLLWGYTTVIVSLFEYSYTTLILHFAYGLGF